MDKVHIQGDCWIWTAASRGGYGLFWPGKGHRIGRAHRWAYQHFKGPIGTMEVCHTCDIPLCVNPDHLFLGTHGDNMRDAAAKGRFDTGGEKNGRAKLSRQDVEKIRAEATGRYGELSRLARQYGIGTGTMSKILKYQTWR